MPSVISIEDRRRFPNTVCLQYDKFWQYKLPCPVDPVEDIYRRAFTDKEWAAMRYLMAHKPGVVVENTSFNLYWTDSTTGRGDSPHVTFSFPKTLKLPDFGVKLEALPYSIQTQVRKWIDSVNYFRRLRDELYNRVEGMMGRPNTSAPGSWGRSRTARELAPHAKTPGQVYRIWPQLQPFFPTAWKDAVRTASAKSRLPEQLGYVANAGSHYCTVEQFQCKSYDTKPEAKKRFEDINQILELMALGCDVIKKAEGYPSFHGPA